MIFRYSLHTPPRTPVYTSVFPVVIFCITTEDTEVHRGDAQRMLTKTMSCMLTDKSCRGITL